MKTRFDIDSEHIKHLFKVMQAPPDLEVINWNSVSVFLKAAVGSAVVTNDNSEEEEKQRLPEPLEMAYRAAKENLEGLHAIRVFMGAHLLDFKATNMLFFHLFPTIEEVFQFVAEKKN